LKWQLLSSKKRKFVLHNLSHQNSANVQANQHTHVSQDYNEYILTFCRIISSLIICLGFEVLIRFDVERSLEIMANCRLQTGLKTD
jgi:hypothetical protein